MIFKVIFLPCFNTTGRAVFYLFLKNDYVENINENTNNLICWSMKYFKGWAPL